MISQRLISLIVRSVLAVAPLSAAHGQQDSISAPQEASANEGDVKPLTGGPSVQAPPGGAMRIPGWTRDARWHQIVVSSFRNGEPSNDPIGCLPWTARPLATGGGTEGAGGGSTPEFGGDLQGLQSKLPYLRKLGVNTLYLTSIFRQAGSGEGLDMRHVDDTLGVADSLASVSGETGDPKTWRFSATDRVFLGFLKEAHRLGLRVVLEGRFGDLTAGRRSSRDLESHVFALTTRWMDPDRNGDPSDGIDGWVVRAAGDFWKRTGRNWRIHARRTNPNAVVAGDLRGNPLGNAAAADFDLVIGYDLGEMITRFFSRAAGAYPVERFFEDLARCRKSYGASDSVAGDAFILPTPTSGAGSGRTEAELARWRLAAVFQHFYAGAPMTLYGDEVGMGDDGAAYARAPMWWNDLSESATKSPDYRGDFLALVRMLNALREQFAPLRHGGFRPVLLDEGRRILAFARSVGPQEAIIVMNYGDTNHQVKLPARRAGQLVRVIHPQLKPLPPGRRSPSADPAIDSTKIARLRVGGSRQFANKLGEMSIWVGPMSVRVALLSDDE